jgi:chromosomal replication initiator protein
MIELITRSVFNPSAKTPMDLWQILIKQKELENSLENIGARIEVENTNLAYPKSEISIFFIKRVVCNYFGITIENMLSKTHKRESVYPRYICMYFASKYTKLSSTVIGDHFGKDHATCLHGVKTVNNLMETDKRFKLQIDEIEKILKN